MPELRFKILASFLIVWIAYLGNPCLSSAQVEFGKTEYLTIDNGMSDRIVNDILLDRQGFMWLATPNGLNRYDGTSFLIYNNEKRNSNKINANDIEKLYQWTEDRLVLQYKNQFEFIDIFSCETGTAEKISVQQELGLATDIVAMSITSDAFFFLAQPKSGRAGVYKYESKTFDKLFELPEGLRIEHKSTQFLFDGNQKLFFISTRQGDLWLFDDKGELNNKIQLPFTGESLRRDNFFKTVFHLDQDSTLWLSFEDRRGMYQSKPPYNKLTLFDRIPTERTYGTVSEDKQGNLLFADINEDAFVKVIYLLDKAEEIHDLKNLTKEERRLICFESNDFEKAIYMGSYLGLHLVEQQQDKIKSFLTRKLIAGQKWGNPIQGIVGDKKGRLFVVYMVDKWYELDLETETVKEFIVRDSLTGEVIKLTCGGPIELRDGYLWGYSCRDFGGKVFKINIKTGRALSYSFGESVRGFTMDSDGIVWVGQGEYNGVGGSVIELDADKQTFNQFESKEGHNPFKESLPIFFEETKDGHLWVGTENGLFEIDRATKDVDVWKMEGGDYNVLSSNYIYAIHEATDGKLWVGTRTGLNIIDRTTGEVEVFTKQDGLPNNDVCGIVAENDSLYWLSTFNGLASFDYKNKTFGVYTVEDGISHYEFNRYSFYKDYKGRIYFGGMNGLNAFRSEDLLQSADVPKVVLTKFLQFDSSKEDFDVRTVGLNYKDEIEIGVDVSYFELEFSLPIYIRSEGNKYKIWLEGYEDDWEFLGKNGRKRFTRLPAGDYRLHILGADSRGNWSNEPRVLNIKVLQPFYKSFWFIGLCVLGSLLLILGYYRWHLYNLKKRNETLEREVLRRTETIRQQTEKLKEQDAVKSRIFAIVGHDLRKPAIAFRGITKKINYLIKKQDFDRIQGLGKNLEDNANALSKLTDNLLNWALTQRDVMPYQPREIQVLEIAEGVKEFFGAMLDDKQLQLRIEVPEYIYAYADQNALNTIIRNLVDNAIKYTPKEGTITIGAEAEEKFIKLFVKDTGVGIPSEKIQSIFELQKNKSEQGTQGEKGTGLGLHLVNELVRLNQGKIEVESTMHKGTMFLIYLPTLEV